MRLNIVLCVAMGCALLASGAEGSLIITEILADPPAGLEGDANNDGVRSSSADEFVEIFNSGSQVVTLDGWSLSDATTTRHTFISTIIDPNQYIVIFGGGSPNIGATKTYTASTGSLSLNNSSDSVSLFSNQGVLVDAVSYGSIAGHDQSIVRSPGGNGEFVLHTDVFPGAFSPGEGVSDDMPSVAVPEPMSLATLLLGLALYPARKICRFPSIKYF